MNAADNAWVLAASALVLLMTPGFGHVLWRYDPGKERFVNNDAQLLPDGVGIHHLVIYGFTLAFGPDALGGFIGGLNHLALEGVGAEVWPDQTIPGLTFMIFQCMFAVITPALISGAFAERMKFSAFIIFMFLWMTFVYCPVAHWVWGPDGWLLKMGALDFAVGTVVHINAGVAALACCLVLGKRKGYPTTAMIPHNLTLTLLGAVLLWFGWFGFNAVAPSRQMEQQPWRS